MELTTVFKTAGRKGSLKASVAGFMGFSGMSLGSSAEVSQIALGTLREALENIAADFVIPALQEQLEENGSNFTGALSDSFSVKIDKNDVTIASSENYGRILEEGSGPRMLNAEEFDKLPGWVAQKVLHDESADPELIQTVTDRVINKLQTVGNDMHPFVYPVITENREFFEAELHRRLRNYLDFMRD